MSGEITVTKVKRNPLHYYCHCCELLATYTMAIRRRMGGTTIVIHFCDQHLGQLHTKIGRSIK